jgi:hypothetical protein
MWMPWETRFERPLVILFSPRPDLPVIVAHRSRERDDRRQQAESDEARRRGDPGDRSRDDHPGCERDEADWEYESEPDQIATTTTYNPRCAATNAAETIPAG